MGTEMFIDYDTVTIRLNTAPNTLQLVRNDRVIYTLTSGLVEGDLTALLRIGEKVSFYRVAQTSDVAAKDISEMLSVALKQIEGGLFYICGQCAVKTRKAKSKHVRAVLLGPVQIAFRDSQLVFNTVHTKTLGNVVLDDTGDTMPLYVQLNDLI